MRLGNLPKERGELIEGRVYWSLCMGRDAMPSRFFDGGWRAFEFIVFKPFHYPYEEGGAMPYSFRFAFAYWFPIYPL